MSQTIMAVDPADITRYRAGHYDARRQDAYPDRTLNPYQRYHVDADHAIAEAARAWHRALLRCPGEADIEIDGVNLADAAGQRLVETLDAEAAWLSRQPGQGAGRASPQSHAPHRPALTEEDR